jgi:hypothetical protein
MKLVGPLAGGSPSLRLGFRLALALEPFEPHEIERHRSGNEMLQGCLIDLLTFVDVDGS